MKILETTIPILILALTAACRSTAGAGERIDYDDLTSGSAYGRRHDQCSAMTGSTPYDDLDSGRAYGRGHDRCGAMTGGTPRDDLDSGSAYSRRYDWCGELKDGASCACCSK